MMFSRFAQDVKKLSLGLCRCCSRSGRDGTAKPSLWVTWNGRRIYSIQKSI